MAAPIGVSSAICVTSSNAKLISSLCVVRDRKPWFLVEVKNGDSKLSDALGYFQAQTGASHAFQVVLEKPFVAANCFERTHPTVVPARVRF